MSEYRIRPTVYQGFNAFKLEKFVNWFFGCLWVHVGYFLSRKEAEQAIEHVDGPIVNVSTQGKRDG